ncbi:MAG TPA: sulfite exporter TauE/SafE family protein [Myxococcota bacterium]|nr:sulfite exporter TauE/SafE family protein [Myxococcota bacterium]
MTVLDFAALVALGSLGAGFLGSLTGLGGGIVVIPMLTLGFGVDIRYAAGAALVSVIATSCGAASAYVREGYSNLRIGMLLEIATTAGAVAGAAIASRVPTAALSVVFGVVLLVSAALGMRHAADPSGDDPPDPLARRLRLDGTLPTPDGPRPYHAHRVPAAFAIMGVAGGLSGLLGIGSGAFKVLALDRAMRLPFKVSTTTSNFMIGVTAAASAGVYLHRGYVDPALAMPVMLGVLAGSLAGARLLPHLASRRLRLLFTAVLLALGAQMVARGLGIRV